jgi:hypothetical protein
MSSESCSLPYKMAPFMCPHITEGVRMLSLVSSLKALIHFMTLAPSSLIHFPEAHLLMIIKLLLVSQI